jgi:hypothetical protein
MNQYAIRISVVLDREHYQATVNTVLKIQVPLTL